MTRLFEIARGVAPLLDGRFRYHRILEEKAATHWQNRAVLSDDTQPGRQIIFKTCWDRQDRVQITGSLSKGYGKTKITVAQSRDIPSIAADINRRFLPPYLEEWNATQHDIADRAAVMELYKHQVDILRRILPDFRQAHHGDLSGFDDFYFKGGSVRLSSSDYDADLRLSLPYADLVRVLMFLYEPPSKR